MIKVFQKYLHQPENDIHGDCWRACIASIIECDIELLPDPNIEEWKHDWGKYWDIMEKTLLGMGYSIIPYTVQLLDNGDIPDIPIIAVGKSPRSTEGKRVEHAVVWHNGLLHDPHPSGKSILDIMTFEVIIPKENVIS